ncbi:MAG TPA: hypothetical protein VFK41_06550 [Nocardioidaceae bacterium]|nr:hypothetical protein [Nocardioidaceae bacterium]
MTEHIDRLTNGQAQIRGTERLFAALEAFTDGEHTARQEIEAAIEHVLRACEECPSQIICDLPARIRSALHDPHGALATRDELIRAEHTDDLIDVLRAHPKVRIAGNGSYVDDKHQEGGHG